MKKIVLNVALLTTITLHAEDSFGLMQGIADYFFKDDAQTEKKVKQESSTQEIVTQKDETKSVVTNNVDEKAKKEATESEESFGLMQGLADSIFGESKEEKNMTPEQKEARKQHITLKEEINKEEPATLQNWFDKQLNQGKYDPENMTEEQRERFLAEEAALNKQKKIDHEKGFTLQSIVDKMFNQNEYSKKNLEE